MKFKFLKTFVVESKKEQLIQNPLPYSKRDLEPIMSRETVEYHYNGLASKYFDRYNRGEGDQDFNYGGAVLHNLFFANLQAAKSNNEPVGAAAELIDKKYGGFDKFKKAVEKEFMSGQGSNWIYMDHQANLYSIHNHEYQKNMKIALLIDAWEHAWALDYRQDKAEYLNNIWRIVDWHVVNDRITKEN